MPTFIKTIIIFIFLAVACCVSAHFALADNADVGLEYGELTGLGQEDPRIIVANIIRIILGFLGIVAVGLIIYAGWLWMTAEGNAEKVDLAKKVLLGAVIGLIICLSAFGIASFILSKLIGATGGSGSPYGGGASDDTPYGGGHSTLTRCDANTLTPACDMDSGLCADDEYCGDDCYCHDQGGYGAPCDGNSETADCEVNNNMCQAYLDCNMEEGCVCLGAPVIEWLSPVDANNTPNGAPGNFITISGRYFGASAGQIIFGGSDVDNDGDWFNDADDTVAPFPHEVNPNCVAYWQDSQIIIVVPEGAVDGPIKVVREDGEIDTTIDSRGPVINDFDINDITRPGLCLTDPDSGYFDNIFALAGVAFSGADKTVLFGDKTNNVVANNVTNWTDISVSAAVPNIDTGNSSVFVSIDGQDSNSLAFAVLDDYLNNPIIDYVNPTQGPSGQYVTIYGSNFKTYSSSASFVYFYLSADPDNLIYAGTDFVEECRERFWHDTYITVKVPEVVDVGEYKIIVENREGRTSEPVDFIITSGDPGPGICLLEPHNGPIGQVVNVYGDNFGSSQGDGQAIFYNEVASTVFTGWANQTIETQVPASAQTGPFKVKKSGINSNTLPFAVGFCSSDDQCSLGEECCASGTYWAGICRNQGECTAGVPSGCGFSWTFSTAQIFNILNCGGYTTTEACISTDMCPNSPGQCQTRGGVSVGECGDYYCNSTYSECDGNCIYDSAINKCVLSEKNCDETSDDLIAGYLAECRLVDGRSIWQIDTNGASCPAGSYLDANSWCSMGMLGTPTACAWCENGFECQDGRCVIDDEICSDDSTCQNNECVLENQICECCCRVGYSIQDCCAGLTCNPGNCGPGAPDYGLCTGCKVIINGEVNQAVSDQSCNCYGQPTRYCEINNPEYPLGVCQDQRGEGDPCDGDIETANCQANDSMCLDGLYCDVESCTCQLGGGFGDPCDGDIETANCQADNNMCNQGFYCDAESCTCQPGGGAGDECYNEGLPACSAGELSCSPGFECLDDDSEDCRCCCNPNNDQCTAPLSCWANKTPCSGENRGLCCGCSSDSQCNGGVDGCGNDTCCRARPEVVQTSPANNASAVCRNILISATFDQIMDITSFSNNFMVIGDYGDSQCPAGTSFLAHERKIKSKIIAKIVKIMTPLFGEKLVALASENHNYCAIDGTVSGYNDQEGLSVVIFSPANILDADVLHYAVIKGDSNTVDNFSEGVTSFYDIGMVGPDDDIFNSAQFVNAKIWSFTVGQDICQLSSVKIDPASYLFQTAYDDLIDNNPATVEYDTEKDGDKVFYARALTSSGAEIISLTGIYSWIWDWRIDNQAVVNFSGGLPVENSNRQTIMAQNKQDAKTTIYAEAVISEDIINSLSAVGQKKTGKAQAYVFMCANPWPPIDSTNYWAPWRDSVSNCSSGLEGAGCINNNFELYYCRDAGDVGTADDLPAILSDAVIRGHAEDLNLLKEYYFLREDMPSITILSASDQKDGGRVAASWLPVAGANGYKLYYGETSGNYDNFLDVGNVTSKIISGLTNGKIYYFAVTAYYLTGAESIYSNEASVAPTDSTSPARIVDLSGLAGNTKIDLSWTAREDAATYKVYYGTSSGLYGDAATMAAGAVCNSGSCDYTLENLVNGINYYLVVTAMDAYENESEKSNEISLTPNSN